MAVGGVAVPENAPAIEKLMVKDELMNSCDIIVFTGYDETAACEIVLHTQSCKILGRHQFHEVFPKKGLFQITYIQSIYYAVQFLAARPGVSFRAPHLVPFAADQIWQLVFIFPEPMIHTITSPYHPYCHIQNNTSRIMSLVKNKGCEKGFNTMPFKSSSNKSAKSRKFILLILKSSSRP